MDKKTALIFLSYIIITIVFVAQAFDQMGGGNVLAFVCNVGAAFFTVRMGIRNYARNGMTSLR